VQQIDVKEGPVHSQLIMLLSERIEFGLERMKLGPQNIHLSFQATLSLVVGTYQSA
jgi:hypothetical protein